MIPGSKRSPRKGNGDPLQYSGLENSMDRGPWRATVHEVEMSPKEILELFKSVSFNCLNSKLYNLSQSKVNEYESVISKYVYKYINFQNFTNQQMLRA